MSIRCGPPRAEASARRPLRGRTCGARQPLFGSELAKERDRAGREQRTFTRGGFGPPASARPNLRRKTPLFGSELAKERNRAGRELRAFAGRRLRPAGLCEAEPAAQDTPIRVGACEGARPSGTRTAGLRGAKLRPAALTRNSTAIRRPPRDSTMGGHAPRAICRSSDRRRKPPAENRHEKSCPTRFGQLFSSIPLTARLRLSQRPFGPRPRPTRFRGG